MLDKRVTGNYNKGKKRIAIDFTKITIKKEESIMSAILLYVRLSFSCISTIFFLNSGV